MYDPRPGGLDGPPRSVSLAQKVIGLAMLGIPIALVLTAMAWGIAWLIVNFPGGGS